MEYKISSPNKSVGTIKIIVLSGVAHNDWGEGFDAFDMSHRSNDDLINKLVVDI